MTAGGKHPARNGGFRGSPEVGTMVVACHHPNYMPWPGFFFKAMQADVLILLDDVQFPLGGSWVNRNRFKNDQGELWLTVPVWKRGRSPQAINQVLICNEEKWARKHLLSLEHAYGNAPYWPEHAGFIRRLYQERWERLVDLNLEILHYLRSTLGISTPFVLSAEFAVKDKATARIAALCRAVGGRQYLTVRAAAKYLDEGLLRQNGIEPLYYNFEAPVYPQLWGPFRANLSILDLLLNLGAAKAAELTSRAGRLPGSPWTART